MYDLPKDEEKSRIDEILHLTGLEKRVDASTLELSGGWRQRLALGCAMIHRPKLMFLDEPTSGVDPVARRDFWDLIYQLAAQGTTIFITTHYMDEAEHCNRVAFMYRSKLMALDTPAGLKSTYLHGDRAHVIPDAKTWSTEKLTKYLDGKGITVNSIETVQSTLEDVFTLLAHRGKTGDAV